MDRHFSISQDDTRKEQNIMTTSLNEALNDKNSFSSISHVSCASSNFEESSTIPAIVFMHVSKSCYRWMT